MPSRIAPHALRILTRKAEEDGQEGEGTHDERVVEVGGDRQRGDAGEACCHQELGAIRDEALDEA